MDFLFYLCCIKNNIIMKKVKNDKYQRVLKRGGILPLTYLDNLTNVLSREESLKLGRKHNYVNINNCNVKTDSQRYVVFQKSTICPVCNLKASFLAYEQPTDSKNYHINMYGINDEGEEILFTKDHIIPKSKGGKNTIGNYQTMCTNCNYEKGNNY